MDTELRPLLPRAMSACAAGCGPSALAAFQVQIPFHPDCHSPFPSPFPDPFKREIQFNYLLPQGHPLFSFSLTRQHRSPPGQRRESVQDSIGRGGV